MRSHLLEGTVRHRRARPFTYEFEHDVCYFALDLDTLDQVTRRLRLVSRTARTWCRSATSTTWPSRSRTCRAASSTTSAPKGSMRPAGRSRWSRACGSWATRSTRRSFFLCRDERGTLAAVVVEVHNTYGERHQYTLRRAGADGRFVASMDKAFFVSPFIDMDARYTVHVRDDAAGLRIAIAERQGGKPLLSTSLVLRRVRLTDRNLLRMLLRHPLIGHKTIALIHWHALRLWLRGARFLRHGAPQPGAGAVR